MMLERLHKLGCPSPRFGFDNDPSGAFVVQGSEGTIRDVTGNGRRAAIYSDKDSLRLAELKQRRPELELIIEVLATAEANDGAAVRIDKELREEHGTGLRLPPGGYRPTRLEP